MTTNRNDQSEQGGIYARRIEAENVVSGTQVQGGDAQTAAALVQLAQAIRRGDIRLDEFSQIITRSAETADGAGKIGALVIQLAPVAAALWQIAQRVLGG